ncbi:hypothetical protein [Vibrio neptunius]|uniref:Chemotaxis protein n=1 Tax=Vibrio neptunius TaxID=170651 RepID=A0ABS3A1G3_9VIBR|nr:hypothetical protein [Vibrio neptunius]MBN3492259.1 hypothetical protein [Vibrio neptunius]MBN3514926.1 hypothetical protein [Vibrio neptunius]MBN3549639.1 hypothetical protein [Vibrio neptunius]MBN3576884.1 hypothetical protein [Vibrio neptunius]MCH9870548.1 hypothetical protein [Vibrio neptunius]
MKIQLKILLFFAFASPVFDALAAVYVATRNGNNANLINVCAGVYIGTIYDPSSLNCSVGKTFTSGSRSFTVTYFSASSTIQLKTRRSDGRTYISKMFGQVSVCPPPRQVNPQTGICEEPPVCSDDEILNPDTMECEAIPFCDRPSTLDEIFNAEQACAAKDGVFSHQCNSESSSLTTNCAEPNACVMGMPNWPECMDDLDPTNPSTPPSGGFEGGSPGTANPNAPSYDKDEPDQVTPDDTTDKAVVEAIRNLNRDNNQAHTALNTDINTGFNDLNNKLTQLNNTNTNIGKKISEQMQQDHKNFQDEKKLLLQQTGAIMNGNSTITSAVNNQTGQLKNSIDALSDKLGNGSDTEPCDPNSDERSCEGEHGLTSDYVSDALGQMVFAVDSEMSTAESTLIYEAQKAVSDPMTDDIELVIHDTTGLLLGVFPNAGDCQPFELPTLSDKQYYIDCQWSNQLKMIFSFCMYVFTVYTLLSILLEDITPQAGTVPYSSRRL